MSQTIITARVYDQAVQLANLPLVASGSQGVLQIRCEFDSSWSGYGKAAVFYKDEDQVYHVPLVNDLAAVPHEVLAEEGRFFFGIMGTANNTRTTEVVRINVAQGALTVSTAIPEEPTPHIYQQLLAAYGVAEKRLDEAIAMRSVEGATVFTMTAEYLTGTITTNGAAAFVECLPTFTLAAGEYADFYIPSYLTPMVPVEISYANTDITVTVRVESSTGKPMLSFYNGGSTSKKLQSIPAIGSYSLASITLSELADLRVGIDGAAYNTAGEMVRQWLRQLNDDVQALKRGGGTSGAGTSVSIGEVTLYASKWVGSISPYSQVVQIYGVTATSQVDLKPSVQQMSAFRQKDLAFVAENDGGVVTVYAIGQKPENDYTMQVSITEVTV